MKNIFRNNSIDFAYVFKNGVWVSGGKAIVLLLSFIGFYALANFAPKEVFGAYSYLLSAAAIASIATLPGMLQVLVRAVARNEDGALMHITKLRLKFGLVGTFLLGAMSVWYLAHGNTYLGNVFLIAAVAVPVVETLREMSLRYWQGREQFGKSSILSIVSQLLTSGALVIALFVTDQLVAIVAIFYGVALVAAGAVFYYTTHHVRNHTVDGYSIPFGFHMTAIQGLSLAANHIDKIIVWHFLGPIAVATYSLAQLPIAKLWQTIPLQTLALPKLSKRAFTAQLKHKTLLYTFLLTLLAVPVVIVFALIAPYLFSLFFPGYLESVPYFQVLLASFIFLPTTLLATALTAALKHKELYIIRVVFAVGQIGALLILTPLFSVWGVVFAVLFGYALQALVTIVVFLLSGTKD